MYTSCYIYTNGDITYSAGIGKTPEICMELSKRDKTYSITNSDYRTIVSAAINLQARKVYQIVFLTYTFAFEPSEKEGNSIIKLFFKRLRRNYYDKTNYVWTKERQKNGRLHYHSLVDMPFISIKDLQDMYNSCNIFVCGNSCPVSYCSLRLPPNHRKIDQMGAVATAKYMAKYISKERGKQYGLPCFGISKDIRDVKTKLTVDMWKTIRKDNVLHSSYGGKNFGVDRLKNNF